MRNRYERRPETSTVSRILATLKKSIPSQVKPALKRRFPIHLTWKRKDPAQWPLPQKSDAPGLERFEYSLFSQNGEDGILRHLFQEIGFTSRQFLEFGFEGRENNSLRLVLKENFGGVFIDGSEVSVAQFNNAARAAGISRVKAVNAFLTRENLEDTIRASGLPSEIDLLSIDVDGNDYWFWEAITCVSPRIAVVEYNASFGPRRSLTIPYNPSFTPFDSESPKGFYHGASLTALERLGRKKGYTLVGCDAKGVNAFFVRNDCLTPGLIALSPEQAYRPHTRRVNAGYAVEDQYHAIEAMPLTEIE